MGCPPVPKLTEIYVLFVKYSKLVYSRLRVLQYLTLAITSPGFLRTKLCGLFMNPPRLFMHRERVCVGIYNPGNNPLRKSRQTNICKCIIIEEKGNQTCGLQITGKTMRCWILPTEKSWRGGESIFRIIINN